MTVFAAWKGSTRKPILGMFGGSSTPEEVAWLIDVAAGRTLPEHCLSGTDRAMVYRLALGTGFRAKELRSLTPASFDLDGEPPTVRVQAACSKRRRTDTQPIRRDLAELLRDWLSGRPVNELLFSRLPGDTARMLRADLLLARGEWIKAATSDKEREARGKTDFLCYENAAGEVADFHSTRHTYVSGIVASGASVKTAQELARHSNPSLTIGRYSHTRLHDLQGALDALPKPSPTRPVVEPKEARIQATGTDDAEPDGNLGRPSGQQFGQQLGGETVQNVASGGESAIKMTEEVDNAQVLALSRNEHRRQPLAAAGERGPDQSRTDDGGFAIRCLSHLATGPKRVVCQTAFGYRKINRQFPPLTLVAILSRSPVAWKR